MTLRRSGLRLAAPKLRPGWVNAEVCCCVGAAVEFRAFEGCDYLVLSFNGRSPHYSVVSCHITDRGADVLEVAVRSMAVSFTGTLLRQQYLLFHIEVLHPRIHAFVGDCGGTLSLSFGRLQCL